VPTIPSLQESTVGGWSRPRGRAQWQPGSATRLDLVNRAFDQYAGLENLPQLAVVLCRQVAQDLLWRVGGIGNRYGLRAFGDNQVIASS